MIKKTRETDGKILVFLKPCDTYSFNQLLCEHRIDREKVYIVGVSCSGMVDIKKVRAAVGEGILRIEAEDNYLNVYTLYGEAPQKVMCSDVLFERCISCKSKKHAIYDTLIGDESKMLTQNRFDEVKRIEAMSADERFAFWQSELSKCIRCNACRDVCPACTCEKCVFDNPSSAAESKAPVGNFEEKLFHIIRAYHVAGRCTDCGECSRVCPQGIPLHLLNRKFIKDINENYGEYQAGESDDQRSPLVNFTFDDPEPSDALKGGNSNA